MRLIIKYLMIVFTAADTIFSQYLCFSGLQFQPWAQLKDQLEIPITFHDRQGWKILKLDRNVAVNVGHSVGITGNMRPPIWYNRDMVRFRLKILTKFISSSKCFGIRSQLRSRYWPTSIVWYWWDTGKQYSGPRIPHLQYWLT